MSAIRMPFGRYGPDNVPPSGAPLEMIPSWYLTWLTKQKFMSKKVRHADLLIAIEQELEWRTKWGLHFFDDKLNV